MKDILVKEGKNLMMKKKKRNLDLRLNLMSKSGNGC